MLTATNKDSFKANLKSDSGEFLAQGRITINIDQQSINFESDFVPLYPIGTPMEMVILHDENEIHRFTGKVYLSDKKFMRIVSVKDELLPGSEFFYCDNMPFSGEISFDQIVIERSFLERIRKANISQRKSFQVDIKEITDKALVFEFDMENPFEHGQEFLLKADLPLPISNTTIKIAETFLFGEKAAYICEFVGKSDNDSEKLKNFLWEYNLRHNKLF